MATLPKIGSETGAADARRAAARVRESIAAVIRGKDEVIQLALIALFARGHLLIEDVPGVGKTTLARALAHSVHCSFQRIQFTSDMLPSDVTGVSVFNPLSQQFEFRPGPLFAGIVLADEINRTTPKTQSALLEAMNEAQVTVDSQAHPLPQPFMVIATQNPAEHHGTFPIPESQLDRFLMRIEIGYPAAESERQLLRDACEPPEKTGPVISAEEVLEVQRAVRRVAVDDALTGYLLALVARTREHDEFSLGVSPRGSMALYRAAQAQALLDGRDYCLPDDFKDLAVAVFAHRCVIHSRLAALPRKSARAAAIIQQIVDETPLPL